MSIEDLRKAAEKVKEGLPLQVDYDPREGGAHQLVSLGELSPANEPLTVAFLGIDPHDEDWSARWGEYLALAANALPKLLAVVEAAQETAETGGNILGLKEALHALEGKEADNVDR